MLRDKAVIAGAVVSLVVSATLSSPASPALSPGGGGRFTLTLAPGCLFIVGMHIFPRQDIVIEDVRPLDASPAFEHVDTRQAIPGAVAGDGWPVHEVLADPVVGQEFRRGRPAIVSLFLHATSPGRYVSRGFDITYSSRSGVDRARYELGWDITSDERAPRCRWKPEHVFDFAVSTPPAEVACGSAATLRDRLTSKETTDPGDLRWNRMLLDRMMRARSLLRERRANELIDRIVVASGSMEPIGPSLERPLRELVAHCRAVYEMTG